MRSIGEKAWKGTKGPKIKLPQLIAKKTQKIREVFFHELVNKTPSSRHILATSIKQIAFKNRLAPAHYLFMFDQFHVRCNSMPVATNNKGKIDLVDDYTKRHVVFRGETLVSRKRHEMPRCCRLSVDHRSGKPRGIGGRRRRPEEGGRGEAGFDDPRNRSVKRFCSILSNCRSSKIVTWTERMLPRMVTEILLLERLLS